MLYRQIHQELFWLSISLGFVFFSCIVLMALEYFQYSPLWPFSLPAALGSMCAVYSVVTSLYRGEVRPISLISLSSIIWYFLPMAFYALQIEGATIYITSNSLYYSALKISLSLLIALPLVFFERRPASVLDFNLSDVPAFGLSTIFIFSTLTQAYLIVSGAWTYGGQSSLNGNQSLGTITIPALTFISFLTGVTTPMAAFWLGAINGQRHPGFTIKILTIMTILVGVVWHFVGGRRILAVELILSGVLYLSARYRLSGQKLRITDVIRTSLLIGSLVAVMWPAYFAMRVASYSVQKGRDMPSLVELLKSAKEVDSSTMEKGLSQEVLQRSALIASYSFVTSNVKSFTYGEGLQYAGLMVLPGYLYPGDKKSYENTYPSIEHIWLKYGIPLNDYGNSLVLDSYVDFGFVGFLIYSIFISMTMYISCALIQRNRPLSIILCISCVFVFINVEGGIQTYLATLRITLIFIFAAHILFLLTSGIANHGNRRDLG